MAHSDASSMRSANSDTSAVVEAAERLRKRHGLGAEEEEGDLLEQNKTLQEAIFSVMYMLSRSRTADSWRWAVLKIVLEGLVPLLVVFNPRHWPIDKSNPVWQVVRWAQPVTPVASLWGYDTYVRIFHALVCLIFSVVVAIGLLTVAMRKQEHSKWLLRFARVLQKFTDALFNMAYVAVFDYIMFLFNCRFGAHGHPHQFWPDVQCLSGRHVILLAIAALTAVIFYFTTALMLVASCELSPVAGGIMASPAAVTRLQVLMLKALFVVAADTMVAVGKIQAVVMLAMAMGICLLNLKALPFLRLYINDIWVGIWVAVTYMCTVHMAMDLQDDRQAMLLTRVVLYGIIPAILLGAGFTACWSRWRLRPAAKFRGLDPTTARQRRLYTFKSPSDVEVVARAMRHFDSDGVILEDAGQLGETIIKCGITAFPGDVGLLILYANYLMEVKRDGPAARTQLQLALKGGPSLVQRYQIFSTIENSKRLKDGQEGQLDLQSYVEFKRNYRAVIRMHKAALAAQRDIWQLLQHPAVRASAMQAALNALDAAAEAAQRVYRRVLERYPNNGKLLRCYGKFLEDVRNEPEAANRVYADAARNGGSDGLLSLDLKIQGADKPEFLTSMDLHEDACVIINAEGKILMVNACVSDLLGYPRAELEGANVSMLMPQPFSSRHPGYISRYVQDGSPHILDSVRDMVALHKDRYVFPVQLCVTKLSGVGTDAVFLGLLRPAPFDTRHVRAWVTPNGVILCTDPQFASLTGILGEEMVGRNLRTLSTDIAAVDSLLDVCRTAPYEKLVAGEISINLEIAHRYLPPLPVHLTVRPGGTDAQRIFIINAVRRTCGADGGSGSGAAADYLSSLPASSSMSSCSEGLMVVDARGALVFATWDVAAMLGYPLRSFLRMKLDQLLAEPFATLHTAKYLRDTPVTIPPVSCRAGRLVHLVNSSGANVPVRLKISTKEDETGTAGRNGVGGRTQHIIQVLKVDATNATALYSDKRLVLLCSMDGRVLSVDQPTSSLFGFTASAVVGSNVADCIDVFAEWRTKAGAHQLELLLLSLLDKEAEMPGTSWRVRVHSPEAEDSVFVSANDPKIPSRRPAGRSACLQTELMETYEEDATRGVVGDSTIETPARAAAGGDGGAIKIMARIILWRRDVLTGVVELDDQLIVRRADVSTGLIVGLPPPSLQRMPLHRLLDINKGMSWQDLMLSDSRKHKPSALKGSTTAVVSEPRAFIGPHPDGGTMRIIVQGVSFLTGGRITATLHPDTTYVGARANLYRALGLEALIQHQQQAHQQQLQRQQTQKVVVEEPKQQQQPLRRLQPTETLQLRRPASRAVLPRSDSARNCDSRHSWIKTDHNSARYDHGGVAARTGPGRTAASGLVTETVTAAGPTVGVNVSKESGKQHEMAAGDRDDLKVVGGINNGRGGREMIMESSETPGLVNLNGAAGENGAGRDIKACTGTEGGDSGSDRSGGGGGGGDGDGGGGGDDDQSRGNNVDMDIDVDRVDEEEDGSNDDIDEDDKDGKDEEEEDEEEEDEEEEGANLHKRAHSQSDFIASWVRSLSRQMTAARDRRNPSVVPSKEPSRKTLNTESVTIPPVVTADASRPRSRAEGGDRGGASRGGGGDSSDDHTRTLLVRASTKLLARGLGAPPATSFCRRKMDPPADPLANDPVLGWDDEDDHLLDSPGGRRTAAEDEDDSERKVNRVVHPLEAAGGGGGIMGSCGSDDGADGNHRMSGAHCLGASQEATDAGGVRSGDGLTAAVEAGGGGGSSIGDDEEGSQGHGGRGTLSDVTSGTEAEITTDARRARLLKRTTKVLSGSTLELSLSRFLRRTLLLLTGMLATHVICYIVLMGFVDSQYSHVREIHRVALAADRCQISALKVAVAEFCSRPGVDPVSVCEVPLTMTLRDLRAALDDLESYHHSVYFGTTTESGKGEGQTPRKMNQGALYDMWTNPVVAYQLYIDVDHPRWLNISAGVWQLGNRFLATGRELLYWGQRLAGNISDLRSFQFLQANGPWSLFHAYTVSLDYLASMAWEDVATLQNSLLIILLIEVVAVQLSCILYEWWLVRRVELRRCGTLLVPLGLPAPVLKLLSTRPLVVVEDSDDEDADTEGGGMGCEVSACGDATAPSHGSLDGPSDAVAPFQGHAVRTTRQRAAIDFAPLRADQDLDNGIGTDNGAADSGAAQDQDYPHGSAIRTTHHRNTRASIDFAPLRMTAEGAGGGVGATLQVASKARPSPPPLPPPASQQSPAGGLSDGKAPPPLEQKPESADDFDSERAAPVRHGVMMLGVIDDGSVNSSAAVASIAAASADRGGGRRGLAVVVSEGRGSRLVVNGKILSANSRSLLGFLVPLLVWEAVLAAIDALSYFWLEGMQGPLAALNMASHVIYRYTRVRMLALFLVSGKDAVVRSHWRNNLSSELANLRNEYDTLLYGGVASTQEGSVFQKPVPASTFESSSFAENFFRQERCFRWDQSQCYTPDSPYYEMTHHGLDAMMRRVISELELLVADDDAGANYTGSRYMTMYMVGTKDLYEGLQSSAQLFVDFMISRYQNVKLLHTLLLVGTILLFLVYGLFILRPYLAAVAREAQRLAGLLSHVPGELDVVSYTRQVMRAAAHAMGTDAGGGRRDGGSGRRQPNVKGAAGVPTAAPFVSASSGGNGGGTYPHRRSNWKSRGGAAAFGGKGASTGEGVAVSDV
ncbi:hypothetical protein VaNZ11_010687 [Volvox africanus]|uniref:PAS domain-containing protein n=1 Tax=Volvox africanus TaxID=51714 RepID=A0ABQ5SAZ8_9CHLO|nr:hypothetical protein VaNZ11_010687 [Volvox africanus]